MHLERQQLPSTTAPDCSWPSLCARRYIGFRDNEEGWPISSVRKVDCLWPRDLEVKGSTGCLGLIFISFISLCDAGIAIGREQPDKQLLLLSAEDSKLDVLCENEGIQGIRRYIRWGGGASRDLSRRLRIPRLQPMILNATARLVNSVVAVEDCSSLCSLKAHLQERLGGSRPGSDKISLLPVPLVLHPYGKLFCAVSSCTVLLESRSP